MDSFTADLTIRPRSDDQMDIFEEMLRTADLPNDPLLPGFSPNELKKRYEYAGKIEDELTDMYPGYHLRTEHLMTILMVDLKFFESGGGLSPDTCDPDDLKVRLESVSPFCKHYMLHRDPDNIKPTDPALDADDPINLKTLRWAHAIPGIPEVHPDFTYEMVENEEHEQIRKSIIWAGRFKTNPTLPTVIPSIQEQAKCLERDGHRCVVTGAPDPQVFWFIPKTWNDTPRHNDDIGNLSGGCTILTDMSLLEDFHSNTELGKTHRAWNMISIHKDLYDALAKGLCAFRYIDRQPLDYENVTVELQLYWMPKLSGRFNQVFKVGSLLSFITNIFELIHEFLRQPSIHPDYSNLTTKSGQQLLSGTSFHVTIPGKDADKFESVVKIQWGCIMFAALCGGAGRAWYLTGMDQSDESMQPRDKEFSDDSKVS
ncbi:hypothetical protein NXS19_002736 [Fusarium pseudograminearum]|nr:hypothetical protein NXS19_002736 [Fusarium pseudograminearum]